LKLSSHICVYITQMDMVTEYYKEGLERLPAEGRRINAYVGEGTLVVYQAFNPGIARAAVENQAFGGGGYRYERMSWIKTSFLWMMYRSSWANAESQKRILAITLRQADFDSILEQTAWASFDKSAYNDHAAWRDDLEAKPGRLQWDPDHDPYGTPLQRRAIQLGLKGDLLKAFGKSYCLKIEDITPFVEEQRVKVEARRLDELMVPREVLYTPASGTVCASIGLTID